MSLFEIINFFFPTFTFRFQMPICSTAAAVVYERIVTKTYSLWATQEQKVNCLVKLIFADIFLRYLISSALFENVNHLKKLQSPKLFCQPGG